MSIDFLQVRQQVIEMGAATRASLESRRALRELAVQYLHEFAHAHDWLNSKINRAVQADAFLHCARPLKDVLDEGFPLPALPASATIIAADGSQIAPSQHDEVEYGLINVGAVQMRLGSGEAPQITTESQLLYDLQVEDLTEAAVALSRDINERRILADLAQGQPAPVITFTDGQIELWLQQETGRDERSQRLSEYRQVLERLHTQGAITAGYVDRPAGRSVVRMLEVAILLDDQLQDVRKLSPLRGVRDIHLFSGLLEPGQRSAVFELQSRTHSFYAGALALHFFYLNVGRPGHQSLARVEVPRWVVEQPDSLDMLHAVLVQQCQVMGSRPYPYLLLRAHETALVTLQEHEQVTQMILQELYSQQMDVQDKSNKQSAKNLPGRRKTSR